MSTSSNAPAKRFVVADVGGTHTRVALTDGAQVLPATVRNFSNEGVACAEDLLRRFLREHDAPECVGCCLAAAGPKIDGRVNMTNLDWQIDATKIGAALRIKKVALLNDLEAVGYALDGLDAAKLLPILAVPAVGDARLVIGVGTGFNACVVHKFRAAAPSVCASECGHGTLPAACEADLQLGDFIRERSGFAAVEEVLSGRGLEAVYAWICARDGAANGKSAAEICAADNAENDPPTFEAIQVFMRILGVVAGDLALTHLPFGGIFLTGGMMRRLAPNNTAEFIRAFRAKGRKSDFMDGFPVALIDDDFAALTGCAVALNAR